MGGMGWMGWMGWVGGMGAGVEAVPHLDSLRGERWVEQQLSIAKSRPLLGMGVLPNSLEPERHVEGALAELAAAPGTCELHLRGHRADTKHGKRVL